MREILFRGKHINNGEWYGGYYYRIWERTYILWGMGNDIPDMNEVDSDTVGQYTGFNDRNGNKIYEGDILSICYEECAETINRVIFSEGAFWLQYKGGETERMEVYDCERATVIGNEWDNPELMEGWTK